MSRSRRSVALRIEHSGLVTCIQQPLALRAPCPARELRVGKQPFDQTLAQLQFWRGAARKPERRKMGSERRIFGRRVLRSIDRYRLFGKDPKGHPVDV